jgi:predicted nucleic acid-binding protein
MPDGLVVDSSAALALLLGELEAPSVRERLVRAAGQQLLVLDLFWLEVINVLVRRHGWDPDAVVQALRELDELGIETIPPDRPMLLAALDLAASRTISAYDAAHLALAEAADASLLTLDERLAAAAGARAAISPGPGTHEERAAYESDVRAPSPDWARHGRYLAELRRVADA